MRSRNCKRPNELNMIIEVGNRRTYIKLMEWILLVFPVMIGLVNESEKSSQDTIGYNSFMSIVLSSSALEDSQYHH